MGLLKTFRRFRQKCDRIALPAGDAHLSQDVGRLGCHVAFDLPHEVDHFLGPLLEARTLFCQRDTFPAAGEERDPQLCLQIPHLPGERRLRHVKALGGLREAAFLGDHQEILHGPYVHLPSLSPVRESISNQYILLYRI